MLSFDWDNRIECCSEVRLTLSRDVITVITAYGKYTRVGRYAATNLCAQNSLHKRVLSKIERDIYSHGVAEEGHRVVERAPPINQFSSLSNLEENKVAFDLSREYISETLLLSYTESKGCFHEKMLQRSTVVIMGLLSERNVWLESLFHLLSKVTDISSRRDRINFWLLALS